MRSSALALALLLAACSADEKSSVRAGTGSIDPVRVLGIGQLDGPPEYAFGRIGSIVPAPDGGFFACDINDQSLRQYDSSGVFVRAVGRPGAGPGEYQTCYDFVLEANGGIVVSDPANGRLVRFRPDGSPRDVVAMNVYGGLGGPGTFLVDDRGRYWRKAWIPAEGASESALPVQMVILDESGQRLDSVRVPAPGHSAGMGFALSTNDGMYSAQPDDSIYAIGYDGAVATASPARYHVRISRGSSSSLEFTRDDPTVPYADREQAEWEAWRQFFMRRNPSQALAPIADRKPFLRGLRIDDLGRVWVHVHVVAEERPIPPRPAGDERPLLTWRERNTYDLFDGRNAAYIGRVSFPYATELMASRGDRVWLREEGEAGEQLIGVYELRAKPR